MTKITSPKWLTTEAKKYYQRIAKTLPPLTKQQEDILAMMATEWETYQTANYELQTFADSHKTLNVPGSQGQLMPHPSLKIQKQALDNYCKLSRQLRLDKSDDSSLEDELDDFFGGDNED